jgi:hypothetical protein
MVYSRICARCDELLEKAITFVRQHETQAYTGASMKVNGPLNEQLRGKFDPRSVESFSVAQAAWDAYREHLIEHGVLTPARKAVQLAGSVTIHMADAARNS